MEENGYRFGVGVLVLSSFMVGILLVVFFGAVPNLWTRHYTVTINFKSAPGISVDTPVLKNGVRIGRVARVSLLEGDGGVNVELELDSKNTLLNRELCMIGPKELVTGEASVEFVAVDKNDPSVFARFDGIGGAPKDGAIDPQEDAIASSPIKNGDYLKGGVVAGDPMKFVVDMQKSMETALASLSRAANRVDTVGATIQDALGNNDGGVQSVVAKSKDALDNFNRTAESIRRVLSQVENSRVPEAIAQILEKLPSIIDESELVVKQTRSTLKSFEQVGMNFQEVGRTANSTLQNIEDLTEPLKGEGQQIVANAMRTVENLDGLISDLRKISSQISAGQGTVGRLVTDEELYYRAIGTLENVQMLTQRLQPILSDVRTFTDKVSRDPSSVVGIRDVLSGKPSGLGLK